MTLFPELQEARPRRGGDARPASWPFGDLIMGHYGLILADPPWHYEMYSTKGEAKSPHAHYSCTPTEELKGLPVASLAAPDCALAMWGCWPLLGDAMALLLAWGFTYKTGGHWHKLSKAADPSDEDARQAFGTGYIYRSASEFWLIGTIGAPPVLNHSTRNAIAAPVREHSRKPDQMHRDLEALYPGPRCELFARAGRPGWDVWGNEVGKFDGEGQ